MSSRKSSASCTKAGSFESSGNDEAEVHQDSNICRPNRQPVRPPAVGLQRSEGFVKFLKTHSSPTHNRVTAGGRIVPMEPKSPPRFALSPPAYRLQYEAIDHTLPYRTAKGSMDDGNNTPVRQDSSRVRTHATAGCSPQLSRQALSDQQGYLAQRQFGHPALPCMSQPQPYVNPVTQQSVVNALENGIVQVQGLSDCCHDAQWHPLQPELYDSVYWNTQGNGQNSWTYNTTQRQSDSNALGRMSAYEMLQAWEQHYDDLDQQLKDIDRHRALTAPSQALVAQRRVIAQQRSDAKDTINEYRAMLGMYHQHALSPKTPTSRFNIDAPAYIPASYPHLTHTQSQSLNQDFQVDAALAATNSRVPWSSGRRPLEIRAPPERNQTGSKLASTTRERGDVDEWGVSRAEAPPEIRRQQSKLSEMLEEERKQSENLEASPFSNAVKDGTPIGDMVSNNQAWTELTMTQSEGRNSANSAPQQIPLDVIDEQRQIVRAINMPKGTVSYVRLLDNRVVSVHGQGLNLGMDFVTSGVDAHARVPSADQSLRDTQPDSVVPNHAPLSNKGPDVGKENIPHGALIHQKAATDAFLSQFNTLEELSQKSLPVTQSLHTRYSISCEDAPFPSYVQYRTANRIPDRSIHAPYTTHDTSSINASAKSRAHIDRTHTLKDDEELLTKGYSCVSVQNVHAIGRVPQGFDGSTDAGRNALSQIAAVDLKSPRLTRRPFGKGTGWYGPYCRALIPGSSQRNTK